MANATLPRPPQQATIPFWRDIRIIAILLQVLFVIVVVAVLGFLYNNMVEGLTRSNLLPNIRYLDQPAGIVISEGIAYSPSDSYGRAFIVGVVNTIRVAVTGIFLATLLGLVIGLSRLSSNWLLQKIAYTYVEIVRNIPLLLQLFFWATLIQTFPRVQESISLGGLLHLSNRGGFMAWPRGSETLSTYLPWLVAAVVAAIVGYVWRQIQIRRRDRPGFVLPFALTPLLVVALLGFLVVTLTAGGAPLLLDVPVLNRFNFTGGTTLTAPFLALLLGLTFYTAAFISEIVRGGIQSVSKGQREAARALGLTEGQMMRLVILPQALRVIIPPMTNQYLNLTKNSSLAIAVGYYDLFTVGVTTNNQTGQIVPPILMIMGSYLTMSLLTSLLMNIYNRRVQIVER
jgi:general L-amino acid transport system permease protein